MSDAEERKRPNAHYRLSKEKIHPDDIVYHYNRERRLEKAPQAVRDLYKTEPRRRLAIFRSLTNSRPKAIMFYSIVVICIMIFILAQIGLLGGSHNLEGNQLSIEAVHYEGLLIMSMRKSISNRVLSRINAPYTGAVNIAVMPSNNINPENAFFHRVFFTQDVEELFRFTLPFHAEQLTVIIQTENRMITATIWPQ